MRPWVKWLAVRRMGWLIKLVWLSLVVPVTCAHWFAILPTIIVSLRREWKSIDAEIAAARAQHNLREAA